jgi:hypothetical protein
MIRAQSRRRRLLRPLHHTTTIRQTDCMKAPTLMLIMLRRRIRTRTRTRTRTHTRIHTRTLSRKTTSLYLRRTPSLCRMRILSRCHMLMLTITLNPCRTQRMRQHIPTPTLTRISTLTHMPTRIQILMLALCLFPHQQRQQQQQQWRRQQRQLRKDTGMEGNCISAFWFPCPSCFLSIPSLFSSSLDFLSSLFFILKFFFNFHMAISLVNA